MADEVVQPVTEAVPAPDVAADASLLDAPVTPVEGEVKPETEAAKPEAKAEGEVEPAKTGDEPASLLEDAAQADEGKTPKDGDGQTAPDKDAGPETYEPFTHPEGLVLDEATLAKATPVLKDAGLSQENAQKLVSFYADTIKQAVDGLGEQQIAAHRTLVNEWTTATKAHPEFGGDHLKASAGLVNKFIDTFSDSPKHAGELRSMMKEWGLGNNPLLFSAMARAAAKLSPDTTVHADAAAQASTPKKPWELLYPDQKPKE